MSNDTEMPDLFAGEGDIFGVLRRKDWSASPLGPVSGWPPELRGAARICLHSGFQMAVLWGERFVYLYNDAASTLFGDKHPWALGQPVETVWPEAWPIVGPMLESVRASGKSTRSDDLMLMLERHGGPEECYITFSYSPIFVADGGVGGIFVAFMETTRRVQAERGQPTAPRGYADPALAPARAARLTAREREILALIGAGLQVKQVAAQLHISASSVNTYRQRIFQKMGLASNAALIRYAVHNGLVR